MIDDSVLIELDALSKDYHYGQLNIKEKELHIEIRPKTRQIIIPNFYHNDVKLNYGTCKELRDAFCAQNERKFPGLNFIKTIGYEPTYFNNDGASHCFIVAAEEKQEVSRYSQGDAMLIDPSFGRCMRFSDSGYVIDHFLYEEMSRKKDSTTAILSDSDAIPIYMTEEGDLFYILAQFSKRNPIMILSENPNRHNKAIPYGPFSEELTDRIEDDKDLSGLVYSIRNAKKDVIRN